jgi:hypothetical protein
MRRPFITIIPYYLNTQKPNRMKFCIILFSIILFTACGNPKNTGGNTTSDSVKSTVQDENGSTASMIADHLLIEGKDIWVRAKPYSGDVLMKLNTGDGCKVIERGEKDQIKDRSDYWYKIEFGGKQGWVFGSQTNLNLKETIKVRGFSEFLKQFASDFSAGTKSLSRYMNSEAGYLQLFNPGAFCASTGEEIDPGLREKTKGMGIYNGLPKGNFCEGYPNIKDGFYFQSLTYDQLPKFAEFDEDGEVLTQQIKIPEPYKNNDFQKVQIILQNYHFAYLYFINIAEDWYFICFDYCDCSA